MDLRRVVKRDRISHDRDCADCRLVLQHVFESPTLVSAGKCVTLTRKRSSCVEVTSETHGSSSRGYVRVRSAVRSTDLWLTLPD